MRGLAAIVIVVAMASGASLAAGQNADSPAQPAPRTVRDGLYSDAQAVRGKAAYMKACAECHAADLGGHEYAGALAGFGFQLKWQDASLAEVYGRVRSMLLGAAGSLTGQEYLDIVGTSCRPTAIRPAATI
jgi:quinoprotein glucose dehydrogenase